MKKTVCAVLAAIMLFCLPPSGALAASDGDKPARALLGDVDRDGVVAPADARLALRASVRLENIKKGSKKFLSADVDLNGTIEAEDARRILRAAVGLESLDLIRPVMTHVELLPGGTAAVPVLLDDDYCIHGEADPELLRVEVCPSMEGMTIVFISAKAPCVDAPVTLGIYELSEYETEVTITVTAQADGEAYLNMVGQEWVPDFGAMVGKAPEQTIFRGTFEAFEYRYQVEFSPDEAEAAFYQYAALLEYLGYEFKEHEFGGYYRESYYFYHPEAGIRIAYLEDWSDEYGEPTVESVWIDWQVMEEYAPR